MASSINTCFLKKLLWNHHESWLPGERMKSKDWKWEDITLPKYWWVILWSSSKEDITFCII